MRAAPEPVVGVLGWLRGAGAPPDEQKSRDLALFARLQRRRWQTIIASTAILAAARLAGLVSAPLDHVAIVGSIVLGWSVVYELARRTGWHRWYHIYVSAGWDVLLVSTAVLLAGKGGLAVFYVLALAPYILEADRPVGGFVVALSPVAYLVTRVLHSRLYEPALGVRSPLDLPAEVFLDAALFVVVGFALLRGPVALAARIRSTRGVMGRAESGDLSVRASAEWEDELGYMERSFNQMLHQTAGTIATIQREAGEVAAHSEEMSASAAQLAESTDAVRLAAARLSAALAEQERLATTGGDDAMRAAEGSYALRRRAEGMAGQARGLAGAAQSNRDSVSRAGASLVTIGEHVRLGSAAVTALVPMSERVAKLVLSISRVARQTNLLSVNASIESARAGAHGRGFAVVAGQVRTLAAETAQAAREVGEMTREIRSAVEAATAAMAAGAEMVRDAGAIAAEADAALMSMVSGIDSLAGLVEETAATSTRQADAMATLAEAIRRMRSLSTASAAEASTAAAAVAAQSAGAEALSATARDLSDLAERMRAAVARFSVAGRRSASP